MAPLNQLLEQRFNRMVKVGLGLEEQEGAESVAPEVLPVYLIENDPPEMMLVKGVVPIVGFQSPGAVAAELTFAGIRNPADSGLILVITDCAPSLSVADTVTLTIGGSTSSDVDATDVAFSRDTRRRASSAAMATQPVVLIRGAGAATVGAEHERIRIGADSTEHFRGPYILIPDTELRIYRFTVNTALNCSFTGYYRAARPGELLL